MTRDVQLIMYRLLWTCLILSQLGPKVITDETYTYTWVQMLLQIGPSLRLGSKCYYRWDLYYTWVQLLHLCLLQRFNCIRFNSFWFSCLKWSCSRKLKFLSYNHPSQLVPSTAVSMVPFCTRPSRCFVLILSPAPSPWDASHSGYCKHKRLTVIIMAIIRYEFTIQHFLFFSHHIQAKRKWHKQLRKNWYELLHILTTISSFWNNSV